MENLNVRNRECVITEIKAYTERVEKDVTMILQSLQWDKETVLKGERLVPCKYNLSHYVPDSTLQSHEAVCRLKYFGYNENDILLPEPFDANSNTVVKLSTEEITKIIKKCPTMDTNLIKGQTCQTPEPLTLERLQTTYTAEERSAIHDAVVSAAPACHDLSDLALPSTQAGDQKPTRSKTRIEILSELRDMKRRRIKYRVAAKTKNYSDVLRDVIKTQMDVYNEAQIEIMTAKMKREVMQNYTDNLEHKNVTNSSNEERNGRDDRNTKFESSKYSYYSKRSIVTPRNDHRSQHDKNGYRRDDNGDKDNNKQYRNEKRNDYERYSNNEKYRKRTYDDHKSQGKKERHRSHSKEKKLYKSHAEMSYKRNKDYSDKKDSERRHRRYYDSYDNCGRK